MSLTPGTRLGVYDITTQIGAGGMGEVYRATDTRLKRDVAIKVLPASLAGDPERLARFQREAEVLATLNHPHIAAIYGLEEKDGVRALVMELVDGDDLSRLVTRPGGQEPALSVAEALAIARQMAEAIEAAHELGIVHRDLKPSNVKVRPDGTVKVLDFGLAKLNEPLVSAKTAGGLSQSPTITTPAMTGMGIILGTAAYMSPEQARGRVVDKRTDIWAFGAVLYEMLTGRRAFEGEDTSLTLAAVMKSDPDFSALPRELPVSIRTCLARCLQKDPRQRVRDMGDVRLMLGGAFDSPVQSPAAVAIDVLPKPPLWRRALPVAATAVIVSAIAGVLIWTLQPPPAAPTITRFPIVLPSDQSLTRTLNSVIAVSPDGTRIVYVANRQLYLREMSDTEARPIPGSGDDPTSVFFSPDGQSLGYYSVRDRQLKTIAVTGGAPVGLSRIGGMYGASWAGDSIVFAEPTVGIRRVSASGGDPEVVVKTAPNEFADSPQMLDEQWLLYTLAKDFNVGRWDRADIVVQSLATGERRTVVRGGAAARFVPTALSSSSRAERRRGHLVYAVGNTLRAVPFDLGRLEVLGTAVPIVEQVARGTTNSINSGVAQYAVSATGTLAFIAGAATAADALKSVALVGLDGRVERLAVPPQSYIHPRISPDGRRVAVCVEDGENANVWVYDLAAGGAPRRLTFGGRNLFPIWTPDGRFVTYQSDREGDFAVFRQLADGSGTAERLTKPEGGDRHEPESWSPDGKVLSVNVQTAGDQSVWVFPVDPNGAPRAIANSAAVEKHSTFSPSGRWIAYMESAEGDTGVYVQPFPSTGAKYQAPMTPTRTPAWSPDGTRLFFHNGTTNQLLMVDVHTEQGLTFSTPVALPIEGTIHPLQQRNYDVMPDGKRLLVVLPAADVETGAVRETATHINVVLNWFEELRDRARVK